MPFRLEDEERDDGLPDGVTIEQFRQRVAAAVADGVAEMLEKALRPHLYQLTGNLDYLPDQDPPEEKK